MSARVPFVALSALALGAASLDAPAAPQRGYDSIAIVAPAEGSTVFDNSGNVDVAVSISPALRVAAGDRIAVALDGRPVREREQRFELSGVDRGEHLLQARVVDADGRAVIASAPVTFYLWRASRLFPARRKG